jgi:EAL domain-containing protein (putative c-di-GMP-specific phosphodiesterase class I)
MIELILDIAEYIGVPVIAEGVENEEQVRLLKEAGCTVIQGYYFSKPVPAADFEKLIRKDLETDKE